jgi:cyanosortase A-associated protein
MRLSAYPRQSWVLLSLIGIVTVGLGRMLLDPSMGKPKAFTFPQQIPVVGWQPVKAEPIQDPEQVAKQLLSSQRYLYRQIGNPNATITVENRYYVARKLPIEPQFLLNQLWFEQEYGAKPLPFKLQERQLAPQQVYVRYAYRQRAYVGTCIGPTGDTSLDPVRFRQQQMAQQNWSHIFVWLLTPTPLLDQRCIHTQVSMPYQGSDPQASYVALEQFLPKWLAWWRHNYPQN